MAWAVCKCLAAARAPAAWALCTAGKPGHPSLAGGEAEQLTSVLTRAQGAQGMKDLPYARELPQHLPPAPGPRGRLVLLPRFAAGAAALDCHDTSVSASTTMPHLNMPS